MPNYIQPNATNPVLDPRVSVQTESNKNPLNLSAPIAPYTQPGTNAPAPPLVGQLAGTVLGRSRNGNFG